MLPVPERRVRVKSSRIVRVVVFPTRVSLGRNNFVGLSDRCDCGLTIRQVSAGTLRSFFASRIDCSVSADWSMGSSEKSDQLLRMRLLCERKSPFYDADGEI